jgi:hypothetical protein
MNTIRSLQKTPQGSSKTYLSRARSCSCGNRGGRTNRCSGRGIRTGQSMMLLSIAVRPVRARVHLVRGRRVALVLSHLVPLRLVGGVGRRIRWAVGRKGRIYRNGRVRLNDRTARARRQVERTCCLSHTCRATGLRVGSVGLGWAVEVVLVVGRGAGGGRRVQTVVRLRGV